MSRTGSGLSAWLSQLTADQLHHLLRMRPEVARPPEPAHLGELATRLHQQHSVYQALPKISRAALQVLDAVLALGGSTTRDPLLRMLGVTDEATAHRVDRALDEALSLALIWPVGAVVHTPKTLAQIMPPPLDLGRSGHELYPLLTTKQLARIGSGLGLGGCTDKHSWVAAITEAISDPEAVRRRLDLAPALAGVVKEIAWHGPLLSGVYFPDSTRRVGPDDVETQLVLQGWMVPVDWGVAEMPRELAMAIRGPDYHAPFDPEPPTPASAPVRAEALRDAARHTGGAAVEAVRRLLASIDRQPLAILQAGGVGVRELRRVAKQLGTDEAGARLWLEIAAGAGLVAITQHGALATTDAEDWLNAEPTAALATLLLSWLSLPIVPGHVRDEDGKPLPAMLRWYEAGPEVAQRTKLLGALAELPADRGLVDAGELAAVLAFRAPLVGRGDAAARLQVTLTEAARLGVVADGALTPLGRELLAANLSSEPSADPEAALAAAITGLLPGHTRQATFLPDLTVVVAGQPAVELSRLLDDVADTESRDAASTWRFTPDSVRRALDGGRTADELLLELAALADKPLPQPLEYLVHDVDRQHGKVQVLELTSCIRVADAALGAELLAHRSLATLKLRPLADTVLAGSAPVKDTIAALRKAGYAPVQQDSNGETVIERTPVQRVEISRGHHRSRYPQPEMPDLAELAIRLSGI